MKNVVIANSIPGFGEASERLRMAVGDWIPDLEQNLDRFYAVKAGVSIRTWEVARVVVMSHILYGHVLDELGFDEAKAIIQKGYKFTPADRESKWTDENGTEFTEFSVTGEALKEIYFRKLKEVLGDELC